MESTPPPIPLKECTFLRYEISNPNQIRALEKQRPCREGTLWLLIEHSPGFTLYSMQLAGFMELLHQKTHSGGITDLSLLGLGPLQVDNLQRTGFRMQKLNLHKYLIAVLRRDMAGEYTSTLAEIHPGNPPFVEPRLEEGSPISSRSSGQGRVLPSQKGLPFVPNRPASYLDDHFELPKFIESGAFGSVYYVRDRRPPHREHALKIMSRKTDLSECLTNAALQNVNLLPGCFLIAEDVFLVDGLCHFLMPYLKDYKHWEEVGPLPRDEALRLGLRLIHCVQDLHQQGWAHYDLSSNNVMVHPKTLDLKIMDYSVSLFTPGGKPLGHHEEDFQDVRALLRKILRPLKDPEDLLREVQQTHTLEELDSVVKRHLRGDPPPLQRAPSAFKRIKQ